MIWGVVRHLESSLCDFRERHVFNTFLIRSTSACFEQVRHIKHVRDALHHSVFYADDGQTVGCY